MKLTKIIFEHWKIWMRVPEERNVVLIEVDR